MKRIGQSFIKTKAKIQSPKSLEPIECPLWAIALFIAIITALFYLPVVNNGFVNWDDNSAITENHHLRLLNLSSFYWMFTSFHTGNWTPLTWLSLALDYTIGRLDPRVYHLHNLLLHIINTLLVFFLSFKILKLAERNEDEQNKLSLFSQKTSEGWASKLTPTIWAAALTACLFGLHPIHVESVVWAAERKGLLCSSFFFASLLSYLDNVTSDQKKLWKWMVCLGLFTLSLLSKPMAITLPLILLLLDFWPLNRLNTHFYKVLLEKIPFFILSLAITVVTIIAQAKATAIADSSRLPIDFRIMNAFHSLIFYIGKILVPVDLLPMYPIGHQGKNAFSTANIIALLLVIAISIMCYYLYRKRKPYLAVAWIYYVITLIPVLGIIQFGYQAAADRYTYLPSWSLFLLLSAYLVILLSHHRAVLIGFSIVIMTTLGFATMRQITIWKDSINLWGGVVKAFPNSSSVIHANMASAYKQFGRLEEALWEYEQALALNQPQADLYNGKGSVLLDKGFVDESIQEFLQASALDPNYAAPHRNLWVAYEKKGLYDLAMAEIFEALRICPDYADSYNHLGISYGRKTLFKESIEAFKKALSIEPDNSMYIINLATTYQRHGQLEKAIAWYKKGLSLNSKEPIYFLNLANTYLAQKKPVEAIEALQAISLLQPLGSTIFNKLGEAYEMLGQQELASKNYEKAKLLMERQSSNNFSLQDLNLISQSDVPKASQTLSSPVSIPNDSFIRHIYQVQIPGMSDAFNATLIEDGTGYLMAFRYDEYRTPRQPPINWAEFFYQRIGFVRLNSRFEPIGKWMPCEEIGNRVYDPRLTRIGDKIFLSYSCAPVKANDSLSGSLIGLTQIHAKDEVIVAKSTVMLKAAFQQQWEKNWVPFNYCNQLHLLYTINPPLILIPSLIDGQCRHLSGSQHAVNWHWGIIRGGTPALLIDGEYLAFFHSSKKDPLTGLHIYYIGAYTFQPQPPFNLTRISSKPIFHHDFCTSPATHIVCSTYSSFVLFPGGLVVKDDLIYVCYGENDSSIKVMEIDKKGLYQSLIAVP